MPNLINYLVVKRMHTVKRVYVKVEVCFYDCEKQQKTCKNVIKVGERMESKLYLIFRLPFSSNSNDAQIFIRNWAVNNSSLAFRNEKAEKRNKYISPCLNWKFYAKLSSEIYDNDKINIAFLVLELRIKNNYIYFRIS